MRWKRALTALLSQQNNNDNYNKDSYEKSWEDIWYDSGDSEL